MRQAKYALDIFQEEEEEEAEPVKHEKEDVVAPRYNTTIVNNECYSKKEDVRYSTTIVNNVVSLPARSSRAIPIVAPPPPPAASTPKALDPMLLNDKELGEEIDKFLSTLNGLELHEKKQLLGDRLFPLVKV